MSHTRAKRHGFILAEALIALLILGVIFLALEGSLTIILRSLADSDREAVASRIAETQRERALAAVCTAASGSDSSNAVVVNWTASSTGRLVRVVQTTRFPRRTGDRVEQYDAIGACQ